MTNYIPKTTDEINLELAKRLRAIRKKRKISQQDLAEKTGVGYASLKRFEQTGDISLRSFTRITQELGVSDELLGLFANSPYNSIEEIWHRCEEIRTEIEEIAQSIRDTIKG